MSVRVRIAPSPTGMPHVGNFRTFLFNWLFARQQGGKFLIRIEDTDQARRVPGSEEALYDAFHWLGLDWDEGPLVGGPFGPYIQSERLPIYHEHVERLIQEGRAYRCYCSSERLEALRAEQQARKEPPGYDRLCRNLSAAERAAREADGGPHVVRFAVPLEGTTTCHDLIHGDVTWENRVLDDFVILKSDGFPTYHLAHLVDDHLMEISHVLRGEQWTSSATRHILLYQAFGWEPPLFGHLPDLLGPDKKKLSKRHGATGIQEFRDSGYLPEALLNYLALCGWSPGTDEEIFTLDELVQRFSLDRVSPSGAIFDHTKLEWFNGMYIRAMESAMLVDRVRPFLPDAGGDQTDADLIPVIELIHDRLKVLTEVPELTEFFFTESVEFDPRQIVRQGMSPEATANALMASADLTAEIAPFEHTAMEPAYRELCERLEFKTSQLFMAIRVGITGKTATPPLFETMQVLGRERSVRRLREAAERVRAG
jgi:glutamyl-tRNA synthetase